MELRTCPPDFSITSSMKHSTSCSHRDSSRPYCEVMVSCLRRLINSAACFTMIDSDSASISLCHEVNTRAAFACARFAYSLAKSCVKFRPVVRTGSVSLGGRARFTREHLYAISICDRPATVSQRLRCPLRIVKCNSRTGVSSIVFYSIRDARHRDNKDCGHTAGIQSAISAPSVRNLCRSRVCRVVKIFCQEKY